MSTIQMTKKGAQKRLHCLQYLAQTHGSTPELTRSMIECRAAMGAPVTSPTAPAGGCGHVRNREKEKRLLENVYAGDITEILAVGSRSGCGHAERREVEERLRRDVYAQDAWRKTCSFVRAEDLLSPEAVQSFARWYQSRRPEPAPADATSPRAALAARVAATRAKAARASVAPAPQAPATDSGLVEHVRTPGGRVAYTMAQPDPWAKARLAGEAALASGQARICNTVGEH